MQSRTLLRIMGSCMYIMYYSNRWPLSLTSACVVNSCGKLRLWIIWVLMNCTIIKHLFASLISFLFYTSTSGLWYTVLTFLYNCVSIIIIITSKFMRCINCIIECTVVYCVHVLWVTLLVCDYHMPGHMIVTCFFPQILAVSNNNNTVLHKLGYSV